jgi:hypothetical protein
MAVNTFSGPYPQLVMGVVNKPFMNLFTICLRNFEEAAITGEARRFFKRGIGLKDNCWPDSCIGTGAAPERGCPPLPESGVTSTVFFHKENIHDEHFRERRLFGLADTTTPAADASKRVCEGHQFEQCTSDHGLEHDSNEHSGDAL